MNIQPLGERVLLKAAKEETKTKGGIYIPDSAKEKKKEGIVVSAGKTKDGKDIPLKAGDKVLYGGYSSDEIEVAGEKLLFVNYEDVLAKLG